MSGRMDGTDDFTPALRASPPLSPTKDRSMMMNGTSGHHLNDLASHHSIAAFEPMGLSKKDMNIGLRLERLFEESFRRWGVFVASHPIIVMIVSLTISIILACGLSWWKVTTDPVDLWVSSSSKARQDMNYFNEHFWKFYRIEQVVIAPMNASGLQWSKWPDWCQIL